jgi:YD repeat-containing protein
VIKVKSFDEKDQPSNGFFCEKRINKDFSQSQMISKSNITEQSLLETRYDKSGRVIETTTNTPTTTNTIEFEYDAAGFLSMISTKTMGDGDSTGITEMHQYFYENGKPQKMLRKINGALVSTISFVADDKGNIIEEHATGSSNDKKYYYYYDDKNRLTDLVHYNVVAKRLLPDYMFEYDNDNKPVQKISVDETGRNYFIWRYAYDDKQLPEIQKCYSKEKDLLGTIQFEYMQ